MPLTCRQCRRVNPPGAAFCYLDGTPLDGRGESSAIDAGSRPFTTPFVLPGGRSCRNFNQMAVAFREEPATALTLLHKGHLETFLGGQGRTDLAHAAHLASRALARAADGARALDDFLGQLPAPALLPARLQVGPATLDLGTLHPGTDRHCELVLQNKGMRLVYGAATCDTCPWLSLGDGPERQRLVFQFSDRAVIPVRIVGRRLRAFRDPQKGEIRLESNGGTLTAVVEVRVPVRPFPTGVLAGAMSPRELASKAKESPREAAALIEGGAVAHWYEGNGWAYPVTGPTAAGPAAVQQLFEALGLVKPPRVELGVAAVELRGSAGQRLEYAVPVLTHEKRAVVAHGTSDQPWLQVGPAAYRGRVASLPLTVTAVPARPGETLRAQVTVTANGNQRFAVPVALVVGGLPVAKPAAVPVAGPASPPVAVPHRTHSQWRVLIPAGLLALVLLGAVIRDAFAPAGSARKSPAEADDVPRIEIRFHDAKRDDELEHLWLPGPSPTRRFGLVTLYKGHEVGSGAAVNRLTFDPWGRTNNTCLRFDGRDERLFGGDRGRWKDGVGQGWDDERGRHHDGNRSAWVCDDLKVEVTQLVELVRGEATGLLDTCRVRYQLENKDLRPHTVGLRFLLDTFIGGNDGVPFTIPGDSELCDTRKDLGAALGKPVPDFLQALETANLARPGTVAHLRLRLEDLAETPERVTLAAWPNDRLRVLDRKALGPGTLWDVPLLSMKAMEPGDSAVVLYWKEQPLVAGARREVGFEYGLWSLASQGNRLAATVDGVFRPGKALTVVAYVSQVGVEGADETVTLTLPDGFKLLEGTATQPVPRAGQDVRSSNRPVTWRVEAGPAGKYQFTVKTATGGSQSVSVEIKAEIFQ
jgi:hypothetical protein